jgi:hypothetical protein
MIPFGKPKIDSLRLLIPLAEVEYIDSKFKQEFTPISLETGEVDEEKIYKKLNIPKIESGISSRFGIEFRLNENKENVEYLVFVLTAKMLKEQYFTGIDKNTIQRCFNYLNETGIVKLSKESFLKAKVVDVDICIDYQLQEKTCKDVVLIAYDLTKETKETTALKYTKKNNTGVQWGHRTYIGKSYNKKQFLKYYSKLIELKYNSTEFYNTFLKAEVEENTLFADGTTEEPYFKKEENIDKLLRVETTIKNKAHWETYGLKVNTLLELLNVDLSRQNIIFNRPIANYMSGHKLIQHRTDLTPTERMLLQYMHTKAQLLGIEVQDTISSIVYEAFSGKEKTQTIRNQKSQYKKKLLNLLLQNKAEIVELNKESNQLKLEELLKFSLIPNS